MHKEPGLIGETLDRYQIVEHLGRGATAHVYKAYQPGLERYVSIKVLHPSLTAEEGFLARFQREAKAIASLRHPNIVQVVDLVHDPRRDIYYMVMEFILGPSLKERLAELAARGEQMPLDEAVRIVAAVADALDYAHRRGLAHRDVKPGNILFTADGQPILTDFGIVRMLDANSLTDTGATAGTPAYMSPEQASGQRGDERSDIYSLGAVLYQALTGVLPFDAATPMGVLFKHINDPLPPPRSHRPDLPPSLEAVLYRALDKDPDRRYQKASDLAADLRRPLAAPLPAPPPTAVGEHLMALPRTRRPETPPAAASRPRRRAPWLLMVVLGLLLMLLSAIALGRPQWLQLPPRSPGTPAVVSPPTPNLTATPFAATLEAIQHAQATLTAMPASPFATPTPE